MLYGQARSASVPCAAYRAYTVDVSLGPRGLAFADDYCGALALSGDHLETGAELYVFLGVGARLGRLGRLCQPLLRHCCRLRRRRNHRRRRRRFL